MRRIAMGAMALAGLSAFAKADHHHVEECLSSITAAKDYFPSEAITSVSEARKFKLEYYGAYKVLTNMAGKRQYILYPCGAQVPGAADLAAVPMPAGFKRKAIPVPAQKAVTAETVSYDFLAQLDNGVNDMGVTDRIVALSEYTTNACGQKALTCAAADNRLGAGLAPTPPGWGAQPDDYQAYMDTVQVYFDFSDGKTNVTGDKSVIFSATSETSLLGRGEWIKFAAAFFNLDHVADRKFHQTKEDYLELSAKAKESTTKRPKVLFLDIDKWSNAGYDTFTVSLAGFKRSAVLDAGGWTPNVEDFAGTGATFPAFNMRAAQFAAISNQTTPEQVAEREAAIALFLKQLEDVDIVIDERYAPGPLTLEQALAAYGLKPTDKAYPFIAKAKWFREDKSGSAAGSAWFETGVSRPDLVLKDFVKVIHPEVDAIKDHQTVFLRDVFANEEKVVLTPEDCASPYPICDKSLEMYPSAPICQLSSFKTCADDSKVYLSASSGCTKHEKCSLSTYVNKASDALPASTSITIAVFMAFVALVLLAVGYSFGKKKAAKKTGNQVVSPDARFAEGAQLH